MIKAEAFKSAMRKWTTGVTIISTNYNGSLFGFTANSFTSVSLSPPLVSFCLNKNSKSFESFNNSKRFAVSILSSDQIDVAKNFAASILPNDKFASAKYHLGEYSNCPIIEGALAHLECTVTATHAEGDHVIFIGLVENSKAYDNITPLMYFEKNYKV